MEVRHSGPVRKAPRADGPHRDGPPIATVAEGPASIVPRPRAQTRTSVPWGLLGALGLIVMIEAAFGRNWLDLSDPVCLNWRFSAQTAERSAPACDVLCLGDSLVKHAIVPSIFERESGLRAVNLAAARGPTLLSYFLFRRALDAGARPRAIIINAKPAVLIGSPEFNARYWPAVLTLRECLELGWISRRPRTALAALAGAWVPSLHARLEIQSNVLAALRGERGPLHDVNRFLWRNWTINGGANLASLHSRYGGELPPDVEDKLHPSRFFVNPANEEGMELLLKLADARGVRVYWLLPPISPGLQSLRDQSGAEARYEAWIRSLQRRWPRIVTVLDARRVALDISMFIDATHLAGRGAIAMSKMVGAALRADRSSNSAPTTNAPLSAGCWLTLKLPPNAAISEADLALEDVDQSRAIIEKHEAVRR